MCFTCKSKIILQPWERGKKGKRLKNPIANNLFEAQQQQQQQQRKKVSQIQLEITGGKNI